MRIAFERPPMFREIDKRFNVAGKGVIFCWGDTIYNPMRMIVTPALMAHEAVHGRRQRDDIEGWWRRYIDDPEFRLAEEIPAHAAEYRKLLETCNNSRQGRRKHIKVVAKRLAGPLYGGIITAKKARDLLLEAV